MSAISTENVEASSTQADFEQVTSARVISSEFRIEEALMENDVRTYHLAQPQETKQAFLGVPKKLDPMNLIALPPKDRWKSGLESCPAAFCQTKQHSDKLGVALCNYNNDFRHGLFSFS